MRRRSWLSVPVLALVCTLAVSGLLLVYVGNSGSSSWSLFGVQLGAVEPQHRARERESERAFEPLHRKDEHDHSHKSETHTTTTTTTPGIARDDVLQIKREMAEIRSKLAELSSWLKTTTTTTTTTTSRTTTTTTTTKPAMKAPEEDDLFGFVPTDLGYLNDGVEDKTLLDYARYSRRMRVIFNNALAVLQRDRHKVIERRYAPANSPDKLLLVSACTGQSAIESYCDLHVEAMDMYAKKYSLDFIQIRGDMDAERLNPWIKIVVLRLLMEKVPYLMWVDADVMFRDMNFNLTKFVELHMIPGVQILTADDMVDIHSSGFLVLRNTTVVKSWMERWYISGWLHNNNQSLRVFKEPTVIDLFRRHNWTQESLAHRCNIDHYFYEQGCLEFLYDDFPAYAPFVRIVSHPALAGIVHRDLSTLYNPGGPPMMHVCCRANEVRREYMMYCLKQLKTYGNCWWLDDRQSVMDPDYARAHLDQVTAPKAPAAAAHLVSHLLPHRSPAAAAVPAAPSPPPAVQAPLPAGARPLGAQGEHDDHADNAHRPAMVAKNYPPGGH